MHRRRCLFLTYGLPYLHSGSRIRCYELLRHIASECDVYLLSLLEFAAEADHIAALRPYCRQIETVTALPRGGWRFHLEGLSGERHGRPFALKHFYYPELAAILRRWVSEHEIDIIEIENMEMAPYVAALPPNCRAKKILSFHNVAWRHYRLPRAVPGTRKPWLRSWLRWLALQGLDARLAKRFDHCLTVSEIDRQRLRRQAPGVPITVVPNGVDTQSLQPLPHAPDPPAILFVGALSYEPNVDAAHFFAGDIFPRVLQQAPAAQFIIVGQHAPDSVRQLAQHPQITVAGAVPDVIPIYGRAQVCVAPIRAGGGTRLKILEALALGRAVVSTSLGCEGLDLDAGQHLLVADSPVQFSRAVVDLLGDPDRRRQLAQHGRQRVAERYDWRPIAARLLALHEQLVADLAPASGAW